MAHYAFLDLNNIVTQVITGVDEEIIQTDLDGTQVGGSSEAWELFYGNIRNQVCKRTSYNGNYRKNYAGIGYKYDQERDAFIPPKPFNKWVLNEQTCVWEAPIPYPLDENQYVWNDNKGVWEIMESIIK
jgi:hypothetical protein